MRDEPGATPEGLTGHNDDRVIATRGLYRLPRWPLAVATRPTRRYRLHLRLAGITSIVSLLLDRVIAASHDRRHRHRVTDSSLADTRLDNHRTRQSIATASSLQCRRLTTMPQLLMAIDIHQRRYSIFPSYNFGDVD